MRVFNELMVSIMPEEWPGAPLKFRVIVKVSGKIEHSYEHTIRQHWFESEFHHYMAVAERQIVKIAKEEESAAKRKAVSSS